MDLKEICRKAEAEHQLTQRALAERIGMQEQNLSAVLKGRRKLPAEAAIELSELTGMRAKEVWTEAVRWAKSHSTTLTLAVAVLASFFFSGGPQDHDLPLLIAGFVSDLPIMAVYDGLPDRF